MAETYPLLAEVGSHRTPAASGTAADPTETGQSGFRFAAPRPLVVRKVLLIESDARSANEYQRALGTFVEVEHVRTPRDAEPVLLGEAAFRFVLHTRGRQDNTGFEFLPRWRDLAILPRRHVVLVGGTDDPKQVIFAIQCGIFQYIHDPCSPEDLARKVRRLFAWAW